MTPFDLVFRDLVADLDALGPAAERAGKDPRDRAAFARVPDVQRLLARIAPPGIAAGDPSATEEYFALLHAAFRFREAGERVRLIQRAWLERALAIPPPAGAPRIPGGACYVQLPPSWFWAQATEGGPHEPLDGCFVIGGSHGEITLVAVLGLRRERGGFTQLTLHVAPADFAEAGAIRRDPAFAPLMDGGAAAGFRSIATPAELLTLVHLALDAATE